MENELAPATSNDQWLPFLERTMGYDLAFSDSNGGPRRVVVRVYKPVTDAVTLSFLEEALSMARRHAVDRFLIDTRLAPASRSTLGDYQLAYHHLQRLGFAKQSRAAILVAPGDESYTFFETVAFHAGYWGWRRFTEERAALEWLGR